MEAKRSHRSVRLGAWLVCASAISASSALAIDTQFRVNAAPASVGTTHAPPTIGLVYGGSGVGGNDVDAMVFCWPETFLSAVALPFCERTCGIDSNFEVFGGGASLPTSLFLRRFDAAGLAIDATDLPLASSVSFRNGLFQTPSIGVRPVNSGPGRVNPFRVAWWDQWSWQVAGPCGLTSCDAQPVGWWTLGYPDFLAPAATSGSADFMLPAWCHGLRPSVAFGPTADLVAWREVTGPCSQILVGLGGQYAVPPAVPGSIVIRSAQGDTQVDRPCAAWSINGSFVVVWREDQFFSSGAFGRRVLSDGSLGPIFEVAPVGRVAPNSGIAASMFDDGSFVVQYVGFDNGDPPREPLLVDVFDAQLDPLTILSEIEVEPEFRSGTNHTITARGPSWPDSFAGTPGAISSVYEAPTVQGAVENIVGRAIRIDSLGFARLGSRTRIPLDVPPEAGNRLGEAHQHTALLRSDGKTAVTWARGVDGNVYCTLRTLPTPCRADVNQDGTLDFQDIFDFLNAWFAGAVDADFNSDGSLDFQDIFDFLNAWFNGC